MTLPGNLRRILNPASLGLLAVALALPSVTGGIGADDYFHRMLLLGRGPLGAALSPTFDLFSFVPESQRATMVEVGAVPWWSDPGLRIALARPLTALTHRADYALWPDSFAMQHLHSLGWFGLGVALVAILYRKVLGAGAAAGLAGLLFAVDDAHALPAAWLANRNALLCLALGAAMILFHLAWRESGKPRHLLAALLALILGLGCGEAMIGGLAYVAAWQLTEERPTWRARLMPLSPFVVVVAFWRTLYDHAGYGTHGSALYVDPGHEPMAFLGQAAERLPLLMVAQWLQAPIDLWLFLPPRWQQGVTVVAVAAGALLIALLYGLARRERLARFWLLGMGFSLVPVCAAFPMDRLLIFAGIGAFGALAMLCDDLAVWPWRGGSPGGWRRQAAIVLLLLHLPIAALLLVLRTATFVQIGRLSSRGATESPSGPSVANQTLVYVNGNDFLVVYTWIIREVEGGPSVPRRVAQLSSAFTTQGVRREDSRTLVIRSESGFLRHSVDRVMASATRPFQAGERIERPDFTAEVRSITADGRPLEVAFRFRRDLEDPTLRWLYWVKLHVRDFPLPEVGQSITIDSLID